MEPNVEQVKSSIGWFVTTFGGFIAGWFAAKGWFTVDQVTTVLNSPALIAGAASVVVFVWRLFVHKQANAVAVVAALAADPASPVKGVVVEPTIEGRKLASDIANAIPAAVVAPAGTAAAANIAKPSALGEKI